MGAPLTDRDSALAYLLGRIDYERVARMPYGANTLKLARMRRLLALLGDPHLQVPAVHIAGSKGKGSTATMIAGSLTHAGHRTGLYTSPHLERLEERLVIDGRQCSGQELVELTEAVRPAVERLDAESRENPDLGVATYFEITTAMAFLHFARRKVDLAVLEVGLGGRLDSTNVCQPLVSVITSISFDHTRQLGNTLSKIAGEKAGILREGVPVVCGVLGSEPRQVIHQRAAQLGSPLWQLGDDFDVRPIRGQRASNEGSQIEYRGHGEQLGPFTLGLLGKHQAKNAATAIAALQLVDRAGWPVPTEAIAAGLVEARCPARIEVASRRPLVVLDAAHNIASIKALLEVLSELQPQGRRRLLFATSRDKDYSGMLAVLSEFFQEITLTHYQENPRGVATKDLAEVLVVGAGASSPRVEEIEEPAAAWKSLFSRTEKDDLLCITGSFFLAAELRGLIHSSVAELLPLAAAESSPLAAPAAT